MKHLELVKNENLVKRNAHAMTEQLLMEQTQKHDSDLFLLNRKFENSELAGWRYFWAIASVSKP